MMKKIARAAAPWAVLVLFLVLLWPARWGGLFGWTVVAGHSMEPTYATGDLVFTAHRGGYSVGDIVVYEPPDPSLAGHFVVHRITGVLPDGTYETQGDNNPAPDQWTPSDSDVQGQAVLSIPRCTLTACGSMGWPLLLFTFLIALAAGLGVFEIGRHGLWPSRIRLPKSPFPPEADDAWDRSRRPLEMAADDVGAAAMLSAVLREEVVVHYEASMSIRTGEFRALELQARWHHPQHGQIKTNLFLPHEERKLEHDFDSWVTRTGIQQFAAWQRSGHDDLRLFTRLPCVTADSPMKSLEALLAYAREHGVAPDDIVFGIPSGPFLNDAARGWLATEALLDRGVRLCLHFSPGARYEPLRLLPDSPFDYVTLDVDQIRLPASVGDSPVSRLVTKAADKGVMVIGRNVSHPAQVRALAEHGAVGFQGTLFAPPLAAPEMTRLLAGSTSVPEAKWAPTRGASLTGSPHA